MELKEDFAANGKLRCMRASNLLTKKSGELCLTEEELERMLVGAWDTDCAYEGPEDIFAESMLTYKYTSIYSYEGVQVTDDSPEESDICELIRSLIYSSKIGTNDPDVSKLNSFQFDDTIANIQCPGPADLEICAGTDNFPGE